MNQNKPLINHIALRNPFSQSIQATIYNLSHVEHLRSQDTVRTSLALIQTDISEWRVKSGFHYSRRYPVNKEISNDIKRLERTTIIAYNYINNYYILVR